MQIASVCSSNRDPQLAVYECHAQLLQHNLGELSWLGVYYSDAYDSRQIVDCFESLMGPIPVHGGTSCMGVMSSKGLSSEEQQGMGMLAVSDPEGSYGVGMARLEGRPERASRIALEKALAHAQRDGEVPALVWMNAAPGDEERLIEGIEALIGPDVPITGGSTADNSLAGNWRQIAGTQVFDDAIVISVFFPSVDFQCAFHSGYDPTDCRGRVTRADGRILMEIDGRPASDVYNQWTGGLIQAEIQSAGNVLSKTTLAPLGRKVEEVGGIPYYKLSHPSQVTADGGLALFSDIAQGDEIVLMTGSRSSLVSRAGRVTQSALSAGGFEPDTVVGALVVYCAGCMLAVREDMDQVAAAIDTAIGQAPFLGIFTFGEQGCFIGNNNTHGNLMISVVVFSRSAAY